MKASLKEFAQTGSFGSIELGMSHTAVEQQLGPPDDWMVKKASQNYQCSKLWKYGDIEFHFDEDRLWMIFADDFTVPEGGSKVAVDAWIIYRGLTWAEAERHLLAADISYRKEDFPVNDNCVQLVTGVGTILRFCGEDASYITLHSIHRSIASVGLTG